jgi:Na+/proline symporter
MAKKNAPAERKFVSVNKSDKEGASERSGKSRKGSATGLRVGAVILWLAAIGFEILVILLLNGTLYLPNLPLNTWMIIGIVADLICVVIGALLWKKANDYDPASEKNKIKFFLWNQMGVIAAVAAFLPLIVILLKNKKLDPKSKKIVTIVAGVALVIAALFAIDYNPASAEDLEQAEQDSVQLGDGTAYWTTFGRSYHFDPDCQTIINSDPVYQGTVQDAFDANRNDPCDFCAGGGDEVDNVEDTDAT